MSQFDTAGQVSIVQNSERRQHRRHDLELQQVSVDRWDAGRRTGKLFGKIVDLSAGGVRIRTEHTSVRPDQQVRVRIELPSYAGICPFIDTSQKSVQSKNQWIGWMAVSRVQMIDDHHVDVAGRLVDMDDMDRGMLSLYLSTQPLAA
jgi:hypothetical protein